MLRSDEVIPFTAGDGVHLNLIHVRGEHAPHEGPGAARARRRRAGQLSARRPAARSSTSSSTQGWDVWLENWRASIDIPRRRWTLDDAAVHDHPYAVRTVMEHTRPTRCAR